MVLDEETGVPSLMILLSKQIVNMNEYMITNSSKESCIQSKAFCDIVSFDIKCARVTEEVGDETEKNFGDEKPVGEESAADGNKDSPANENEEKEPEEKVNDQFH